MSYLNKTYKFVKQENFEEFLKFFGAPAAILDKLLKVNPDQTLTKDGDTYTFTTGTPEGSRDIKFKSGVEFDDVFGPAKTPVKATFVVDGNKVSQIIKTAKGTVYYNREYNGDDLVVTVSADSWDGVAKMHFKA